MLGSGRVFCEVRLYNEEPTVTDISVQLEFRGLECSVEDSDL
jgi:hypothetical protein